MFPCLLQLLLGCAGWRQRPERPQEMRALRHSVSGTCRADVAAPCGQLESAPVSSFDVVITQAVLAMG